MKFCPALLRLTLTMFGFTAGLPAVIVGQDARGPATTDPHSILVFLESDQFEVLGITP